MKLSFFILLLPLSSFCQKPDDNTIIVKDVSFGQVCNALLDSGYVIDKKDNDLQTVKTERREYPKYWAAHYTVNVRVKDSTAYITATIYSTIMNEELAYYHANRKGKVYPKSLAGYPFLLINQWAGCFGKELAYSR